MGWLLNSGVTRVVISLLIGFVTWMLVTWVQNPFREDWIPGAVAIETAHLPAGLVEVGLPGEVRIKVRAGQEAWASVQSNDFKAAVDLTHMSAGIQSVDVKVQTSGEYQIVDWRPRRVTVRMEPLEQRSLPVKLHLTGKLSDGYAIRAQVITPSEVSITGVQDAVQSVSEAAVTTNLDGITGDVTQSLRPDLLDDHGRPVHGLQLSPDTVQLSIGIDHQISTKTVPVRVTTTGQVAPGYLLTGLSIDPQSVLIAGGPVGLSQIDAIDLPPINLNGAKTDITATNKLSVNDKYQVVDTSEVTVKATVAALRSSQTVPVAVDIQGVQPGSEARADPAVVQVTLSGLVPMLLALKPGDVTATIDASGLSLGSHEVPIRLNAPGFLNVAAAQPDHVVVVIRPMQAASSAAPPSASPVATPAAPSAATSAATPAASASAVPTATPAVSPAATPAAISSPKASP